MHSTNVWLDLVSLFSIYLSSFLLGCITLIKQAKMYHIKNSFGDFKCVTLSLGTVWWGVITWISMFFFSLYTFLFYLCIYICTAGLSLPKCRFSVIKQSRVVCQRSLVVICTELLHRFGDNLFSNLCPSYVCGYKADIFFLFLSQSLSFPLSGIFSSNGKTNTKF